MVLYTTNICFFNKKFQKFTVGRKIKLANVAKMSPEDQNIKIYLNRWGDVPISKYCLTYLHKDLNLIFIILVKMWSLVLCL